MAITPDQITLLNKMNNVASKVKLGTLIQEAESVTPGEIALASGKILIGSVSNVGAAQTVSGDISLSVAGVSAYVGTVPVAKGGTGQVTVTASINALLPSQAAQAGKFLKTDGTNISWAVGGGGGSGNMNFLGDWDPSINTPSLADGTGTVGQYYRVSVADTINLGSGFVAYQVNDYILHNGTIWTHQMVRWPLLAPNGTVNAPSYGFVSDIAQDTGMYLVSDGIIGWSANGALAMSLDNNGDLDVVGDITAANFPVVGVATKFAFFNDSADLTSIDNFAVLTGATQYFGLSTAHQVDVNNLSGGSSLNQRYANFVPLQNSPDDSWNYENIQLDIDTGNSGFTFGTNGSCVQMKSYSFSHQGTSDIGTLAFHNHSANIGNGIDPITVGGYVYSYGFGSFNANVTVDGGFQGYGFQPNVSSSASSGSNFAVNAFFDQANIGVAAHGYRSYGATPIISEIANNRNYDGYSLGPTITTFTGNAGFFGYALFGTVTTMSATGSYQGFLASPTITTGHNNITMYGANPQVGGGDAQVTLFDGSMGSVTTSGNVYAVNINGTTATGRQSQFNVGGCSISTSGAVEAANGLGVGGLNSFQAAFTLPDGVAIVSTDYIVQNHSGSVWLGDVASTFTTVFGFGINMVGAAGAIGGHGTADIVSSLVVGASIQDDFILTDYHNINALTVANGFTGTITNASAFYHDLLAGPVAVNHWGVKIVADIDNYVTKLAINTASKKVTNASVALEIGGTDRAFLLGTLTTAQKNALTAVNGMMCYDSDLAKFQGYEAGSWQNLI